MEQWLHNPGAWNVKVSQELLHGGQTYTSALSAVV